MRGNANYFKTHKFVGIENYAWKGDHALYGTIHDWVYLHLGKPQECVYCGKAREEGRIEWASISHKAKRDLEDYISLCVRCHRTYDGNMPKNKSKDPVVREKLRQAALKDWAKRKRLAQARAYYDKT